MEFYPKGHNWKDNIQYEPYEEFHVIIPCTLDYPYDWIEKDEENWFTLYLTLNEDDCQFVEKIEYADHSNPYCDIRDLRDSEQQQILFFITNLGFKLK